MLSATMESVTDLNDVLKLGSRRPGVRRSLFAWVCLGVVDQIRRGALTPETAVQRFFHGHNCLYVRRSLKNAVCDEIMGRGIQLADLFEMLAPQTAARELRRELSAIESLCQQIIDAQSESQPRNVTRGLRAPTSPRR